MKMDSKDTLKISSLQYLLKPDHNEPPCLNCQEQMEGRVKFRNTTVTLHSRRKEKNNSSGLQIQSRPKDPGPSLQGVDSLRSQGTKDAPELTSHHSWTLLHNPVLPKETLFQLLLGNWHSLRNFIFFL